MEDLAIKLKTVIQSSKEKLQALSNATVSSKSNPDKWSKKELLGHLVDSAANNHRRFIIARSSDNLIFDGYAQDTWVSCQDYQNADWSELVTLFVSYNLHLSRVIDNIPTDLLNRQSTNHNFHRIAFKIVPEGEPSTLAYFVNDYIEHIEHHLRQILE